MHFFEKSNLPNLQRTFAKSIESSEDSDHELHLTTPVYLPNDALKALGVFYASRCV